MEEDDSMGASVRAVLEVALHPRSVGKEREAEEWARRHLEPGGALQAAREGLTYRPQGIESDPFGDANVVEVCIAELDKPAGERSSPSPPIPWWQLSPEVYAFVLCDEGRSEDAETEDEQAAAFVEEPVPCSRLLPVWRSLRFSNSGELKGRLLRYAGAGLRLSQAGVDTSLVRWNRVILLHGPPGTGKTSLCKALACKLAIRHAKSFPRGGLLVEVNAHSLFSRWFSESSKQVSKLFSKVDELAEDPSTFVCVLIDEVESLAHARKAVASGSEPSDALRVVNAVLTRLDDLRERPNVLVACTSNITEAVDLAFVDRADLKAYVPPPDAPARKEILESCFEELARVGILCGTASDAQDEIDHAIEESEGYSGRLLRRLPFLAAAESGAATEESVPARQFALSLRQAIRTEREDRQRVSS